MGAALIKAVILDLDGTIIGPDEQIRPAVLSAVGRLAGKVPVSIATGRESKDVVSYARRLGPDCAAGLRRRGYDPGPSV